MITDISNITIYFPDALDGASMLDGISSNYSYYKDTIHSFDENTTYKTKLFFGIGKVIELANLFKCVYLDKIEFLFIVKNMYENHPKICVELLNSGKISFIDSDKYFMFYGLRETQFFIQIHNVPKMSNDSIADELFKCGGETLKEAFCVAASKSIKFQNIDCEKITNTYFENLKQGFFQGLGIGINNIIGVNNDNKELYDLIAQLTLDLYVCDLCEIKAIYLKEYFYWADKYKCRFKNNIFARRTCFNKLAIPNYAFALAANQQKQLTNEMLQNEAKRIEKNLHYSCYQGDYSFLKYSFSNRIKEDYANNNIVFVNNGDNVELALVTFEEYLKELQKKGQALRQTKLFIKITPKRFLSSFLKGNIKFSKPIDFIDDKKSPGQNDITEATFISELKNGKRVCTRNIYDLNFTLIWCCFGLDNYMFVDSIRDGQIVKKAIVKKEYYSSFLNNNEENAIVFIKPDVFIDRLVNSLVEKGIESQDIIICPITYINKHSDFLLSCEPPFELFYKDLFFLPQNEVRVLVRNSGNKYDYLFDQFGVINIGDISDICTVINGMYHKDMECFLVSDSKMEFTLPD